MKKLSRLLFGSLLLPLIFNTTAIAAPEESVVTLDRIIAVVDNDVITRGELDDRIRIIKQQLAKQGTPLPPQEALEKQLLERMITDRLQYLHAGQTGLRVDDNQLDKTIERIADRYLHQWHADRLVLIGYSFGADVLPDVVSRLRADLRHRVEGLSLIAPSSVANYEVHVTGWLGVALEFGA